MSSEVSQAPVHRRLETGAGRVLLVGDVHGCAEELLALLEKCSYSHEAGDIVILVGDLVNKGPDSARVVQLAVDSGFHAVVGNHDLIGLDRWESWHRTGQVPSADKHGSYDFVAELRDADIAWLRALPLTLELVDHGGALIVHAGLLPGVSLEDQLPADLYNIRNVVPPTAIAAGGGAVQAAAESAGYRAVHSVSEGIPWAEAWDGRLPSGGESSGADRRFVFFGHDAPRGLQQRAHAWGLDTNCCDGGRLTACVLPSRELLSVPARGRLHEVPGSGGAREWRRLAE